MGTSPWRKALAITCFILIGLVLLALLVGCGKKDDLEGKVTNKSVKAGYTFVMQIPQYTQICSGAGTSTSPRTCTQVQTGSIPIIYDVPTCYRIDVEGEHSGNTCVDESKWNAIAVGDDYVGKDVDPKEQKVVHH